MLKPAKVLLRLMKIPFRCTFDKW